MQGNTVEMEIRVHGNPLREYQHKGQVWIEGRKGSDFTLRFKNRTGKRLLVIPSVDGLSIMDGEKASSDSSGYILKAYEFIDVPGWRLNNESIAKFVFGKKGKSYAATKGEPMDVGVIGVMTFFEKEYRNERFLRSTMLGDNLMKGGRPTRGGAGGQSLGGGAGAQSFNSSCAAPMDKGAVMDSMESHTTTTAEAVPSGAVRGPESAYFNQPVSQEIGTEFGEQAQHLVVEVPFEKASEKAEEKLAVRYDSKRNLRRRGVDLDQKPRVTKEPNAFPGDDQGCEPPTGWDG